jgi:GT2 family glycosyltransferase
MTGSISLLVITYNRPEDMLDLLHSLKAQRDLSPLKEVLILNNASTVSYDSVEKFIGSNPDLKINYIVSDENLGVSRGRNKLMKLAAGDHLLVLDDDILFHEPLDLKKIGTVYEKPFFKESNTGVITFRVIYHSTKEVQRTALPHKHFEEYKDKDVFLTSYFTGCAHFLRKEVLERTGYYPEDFFYGMEEYDLSYRIVKAGYSLGYDNIVTFEHKESPGGRQANYNKLSSQWVNKSKVAYRYLPFPYYITTMVGWSFEYVRKVGGHWGTFFRSWGQAIKVPFTEKRRYIGKNAMDYLRKVKARLWY